MTTSLTALRAAWRIQDYAEHPGIVTGPELKSHLGLSRGDDLYDFGCGDGQMVEYFNSVGVVTMGLDMIKAHPDTILCNLTQMDQVYSMQHRQYGVCLGMMDHIPEKLVPQTLTCLAHLARKEIYFTIPIRDFGYNELTGKRIQQTIKPIGWWRNKLLAIGVVKIGQVGEWMTAHVQCT